MPKVILFPIFTISILKWIIITNEIFETNALFEVNSKQSDILQFALTRGKRSNVSFMNFYGGQFTSSTQLMKPNYLLSHKLPVLRKVITAHVKKYRIFARVLIYPISCWHVTRIWCHSVRLMNERKGSRGSIFWKVGYTSSISE